jgi:ElaB/YqjD/DUF883 family membrane-anchored ribosome-binding protein
METASRSAENLSENPAGEERPPGSSWIGSLKHSVADKLHGVANALGKSKVSREAKPEIAHVAQQASSMVEQSAQYVREWEYSDTEAAVREYIQKNPGRSLIIAGLTGLVVGTLLRRRW